jgi:hypothetical protein
MKALALALAFYLVIFQPLRAEDMQKYLSYTRVLVEKGKYQEALERVLWFHDHALEHDEAMYGVRLSYALNDWLELGKVYPPAATALVATRDQSAKSLREGKGDKALFHDVAALNRTLEQPRETLRLFEYLSENHPAKAVECWDLAKETVLAEKRYDLAKKYAGNAVREFAKSKERFNENKRAGGGMRLKEYNEGRLVKDALLLIQLALSLDDRAGALEIQKEASSLVDDPRLHDAVPAKPSAK